ncbi:MAG: cation diffusion facilitator family transporter [Aphanocapsa lilacina HA4352-LM1]|jgi:cation diffusion facilitator family transporter|nr:cation diffusion facilitator family transporter [Aphanocapsa lilacina HA4352-LM1]
MNVPSAHATRPYALLSIAAAVGTIALKFGAYALTGSIGLLSDAAESGINLVTALVTFWALTVAARAPDQTHPFGHSKAEYFSSGLEGALILVAAVGIAVSAVGRLFAPQPLEQLGLGMGLSLVATALNGGVAAVLMAAGKRLRSLALQADAQHLLTDVWTSTGVVAGLVLVQLSGWLVLDPLIALAVAINIVWAALRLLREAADGLMDRSLSDEDTRTIEQILVTHREGGLQFHALRTRQAASRRFISLHVLVPGAWSVQHGHALCEQIERAIEAALPHSCVTTHLEPIEDPLSWADAELDRTPHTGDLPGEPRR